jgi:hypothetical protein
VVLDLMEALEREARELDLADGLEAVERHADRGPDDAASASGLSMTRCEPNFRCRSSVTRKTPPSTPTSSPMTSTSPSRSISWSSARFSALTMFSWHGVSAVVIAAGRAGAARGGMGVSRSLRRAAAAALGQLARWASSWAELGVDVIEHRERIGPGGASKRCTAVGDLGVDLRLQVLSSRLRCCR